MGMCSPPTHELLMGREIRMENNRDNNQSKNSNKETDLKNSNNESSKENILKILKTFPGVGQVMAERIYEAGFDSKNKLTSLSVEELKKIPGIGKSIGESIVDGMELAIKQFEEPVKKEEVKKDSGITDKAMGFVKGTISKITGFFKGKHPKKKTMPSVKSEVGIGTETEDKVPETEDNDLATDTETKVEIKTNDTEETKEAIKETYFPEVGAPGEENELEAVTEPVTIESSNMAPKSDSISVSAPLPVEPELPKTPLGLQMGSELNLNDSSGLLKWFESAPNFRAETGRLLFKAGYNNLNELREAVVEDLVLVKGITPDEARMIYGELHKLS